MTKEKVKEILDKDIEILIRLQERYLMYFTQIDDDCGTTAYKEINSFNSISTQILKIIDVKYNLVEIQKELTTNNSERKMISFQELMENMKNPKRPIQKIE